MKTQELFNMYNNAHRLNESMGKVFGTRINLENFDLHQLQDARNKIRTQVSQVKSTSGFNENLQNEAYHQAQFMLDTLNAEIAEREEFIIDSTILDKKRQVENMKNNRRMVESSIFRPGVLTEGEIQQASAIVTAKTMVDRVSRWVEELSGMENDTLLDLGDSIRDEMGQELAKQFVGTVAPAIQNALEMLKQTRETLATGVRTLTGEEQSAEMLGAAPVGADDQGGMEGGAEMQPPAEDGSAPPADEFAAADAAAGGAEAAGREQRESINFQNRMLRVLAG